MIYETVVHNVTEEESDPVVEPEVQGDCTVHNVKPEEVIHKLPEPQPKKIVRKWYEMIDKRA